MEEPEDRYKYTTVLWDNDLLFYKTSLEFYEKLINSNIKIIDDDPDLNAILSTDERRKLSIYLELDKINYHKDWIQKKIDTGKNHFLCDISHGAVKFIKSVASLYINHLQNRRNNLASRKNLSKHVLEATDNKIAQLRELVSNGIFQSASTIPLLVDELSPIKVNEDAGIEESLTNVARPRPILIESIEIIDSDLKSRCLDLFNTFESSGQRDRHDTVLNEATRIFETKLRNICGAQDTVVGLELASYALGGNSPKLIVSDIPAEQEAAHLLFRGIFGFIRNVAHHRLLGELQPERVVQVLGTLDYCLAIAKGAKRNIN